MRHILILSMLLATTSFAGAQGINWGNQSPETKHLVHAYAGINFGLVGGAGYAYRLPTGMPILLSADFSLPSGDNLTDDFKSRLGVQIRLLRAGNFQVSTQLYGVFRRYENEFSRILNFGSDMSAAAGYYRKHWFIAAESGFDKAIVSHFKHSAAYRDIYPQAEDGWFQPPTGGNFYYGLQTGLSFGRNDLTLRTGMVVTQDFKTAPLLPFYAQLGYNRSF